MKSLRLFHLLFTLLLIPSSSLLAQYDGPDIQLRFRALALNYPLNSGVYMEAQGGTRLNIYSNSRTDWVNYKGTNPITFYKEVKQGDTPSVRIPIASFDAVQAPENPLLIFSKADAKDPNYRVNAVNDSVESSPAGSYRIFNFTEKQIGGVIDDQRFLLSPKSTAYAQVKNPKDFEVTVQLAESEKGQAKRLYASSWTFSEDFRYLVFILPSDDPTRGNIEIRLIPDLVNSSSN
ncbi:hypothetical protein [Cerasicoccus arenae]|uniref:DUF3108 domain-containing protein n=1 Tax=Cerasicoccus arenae TaxID=424488 RepID=A0A8J3GF08_9BACT|nr:hypothetical protein [Cerasicoccus arenae]MBK1859221.1 hypothetical protein [Cerasicoccus arenae]GHC02696.1 hypothetical protein GCM10007047_19160 [Cerasicoccus arenae]